MLNLGWLINRLKIWSCHTNAIGNAEFFKFKKQKLLNYINGPCLLIAYLKFEWLKELFFIIILSCFRNLIVYS